MGIFREFGIPVFSGYRNFGNSVFPFRITKFSVFPCIQKKSKIFFKNLIFFHKLFFWGVDTNSRGFPCIFGIPAHFQDSHAISGFPWIKKKQQKTIFFFQKLSHLAHYLEKLSKGIKVGIQKMLYILRIEKSVQQNHIFS